MIRVRVSRSSILKWQPTTPSKRRRRNQVCPCTGPLTFVARLIDSDNFVGFCSVGSFILNLRTDEVDWLERVDDRFELELEIVPYAGAKEEFAKANSESVAKNSGFPGRR